MNLITLPLCLFSDQLVFSRNDTKYVYSGLEKIPPKTNHSWRGV